MVAALGLVMLAAALNLSGLYEIGTSVQGLGAGLASRGDLAGSAAVGVLAVVVAAPCTAPFMGPALGYALTQPPAPALAVFLALGLGFAAPFTLLAFSPALMRRLPRPGAWMDILRKALAFPMYGAAAWLAWVLAQQSGPEGLARMLAAAVVLAFAAWLFGLAQRRRAQGRASPWRWSWRAWPWRDPSARSPAPTARDRPPQALRRPPRRASWRPSPTAPSGSPRCAPGASRCWSTSPPPGASPARSTSGLAFSSAEVAAAVRRTGATYLVADWTNRDAVIAKALADQGRIGVPLYLVYGAGGGAPKTLPQLLTPAIVAQALDTAAKPLARSLVPPPATG